MGKNATSLFQIFFMALIHWQAVVSRPLVQLNLLFCFHIIPLDRPKTVLISSEWEEKWGKEKRERKEEKYVGDKK